VWITQFTKRAVDGNFVLGTLPTKAVPPMVG